MLHLRIAMLRFTIAMFRNRSPMLHFHIAMFNSKYPLLAEKFYTPLSLAAMLNN